MLVSSSQREPLSIWPRLCEVKRVTKMDEKEGKIEYLIHRRRDEDLVKTHGPQMRVVPEFCKNYGLLNETSLEKIGGGLFGSHFFTVYRAKSKIKLII
jgi:hypothetical protein